MTSFDDFSLKIPLILATLIFIPPVYEVYRGYIVFAFSVCVFVCVLTFFPSKISQELLYLGS